MDGAIDKCFRSNYLFYTDFTSDEDLPESISDSDDE